MSKNIFLTGTAGSGKSNLTGILSNWYQQEGRDVITVNLDPGVSNVPYGIDVDIRNYNYYSTINLTFYI